MSESGRLYESIINGNAKDAVAIAQQALNDGCDPMELVTRQMIPAMDEVGKRFECEEYFVPELLLSGRAMKAALERIRPLLAASGAQPAGRIVIGTVKGDLHDIGKNLVASMLEGGGFGVHDLGADVVCGIGSRSWSEERLSPSSMSRAASHRQGPRMRGPYRAHRIRWRDTRIATRSCRGRACPARDFQ